MPRCMEDIRPAAGTGFAAVWCYFTRKSLLIFAPQKLPRNPGINKIPRENLIFFALSCCVEFYIHPVFLKMDAMEDFLKKQRIVSARLKELRNCRSIRYNWHDADTTLMEGIFARGDRRLAKSILDAYRAGCFYDAWSEHFNVG